MTLRNSSSTSWNVRGADAAVYLPNGPIDSREIADIMAESTLPSSGDPTGAEDWNTGAQAAPMGLALHPEWPDGGKATGAPKKTKAIVAKSRISKV